MSLHRCVEALPLPPKPFVLSTTSMFEGDDGKWSTLYINLGDSSASGAGQNFRVLPSTSSPNILIPRQSEWCVDDCSKLRGIGLCGDHQPQGIVTSKEWQEKGMFGIPTPWGWPAVNIIDTWNSTPSGLPDTDYPGLGESSSQSPILISQYIIQYTIKEFFSASLGWLSVASVPKGPRNPTSWTISTLARLRIFQAVPSDIRMARIVVSIFKVSVHTNFWPWLLKKIMIPCVKRCSKKQFQFRLFDSLSRDQALQQSHVLSSMRVIGILIYIDFNHCKMVDERIMFWLKFQSFTSSTGLDTKPSSDQFHDEI